MKYKNKPIDKPKPEIAVIPRDSGNIVITCEAVFDFTDFDLICKEPPLPDLIDNKGQRRPDPDNEEYKQALIKYGQSKHTWMLLKSIMLGTPDLSFEKIDFNNPETWTWDNLEKEFLESGFTRAEFAFVLSKATAACGLSTEKLEEATKSFLAGQVALQGQQPSLSIAK